jgi:hypothetical protein
MCIEWIGRELTPKMRAASEVSFVYDFNQSEVLNIEYVLFAKY